LNCANLISSRPFFRVRFIISNAMIQSLPRDQGQRLNIRGQGLGSEVICKYFVWTDRKHKTFHTVT